MESSALTSDFLFVRPSLARGFFRTLDVVGSLDSYNWSSSNDQVDASAMYIDWALVGSDIAAAMKEFSAKPIDRGGNEQLPLSL